MKILITLSLILFSVSFCGNPSEKVPVIKPKKQDVDKEKIQRLMLQPFKEKVVLLALKHKIDESTVEGTLDGYLSKHDLSHSIMKMVASSNNNLPIADINDSDFKNTIRNLSIKFNISEDKLSAIIIDYKMWEACEQKRENNK